MMAMYKYETDAEVGVTISDAFIADSFIERLFGYMLKNEPHHQAIVIKPCNSIHTFFMKFDIDVLFINKDMKITKKLNSVRPGKLIMPVWGTKMVIEAKAGVFANVKTGSKVVIN